MSAICNSILILFSACGSNNERETQPTPLLELETYEIPIVDSPMTNEDISVEEAFARPNFVDVRVKLLTAIFRRARRELLSILEGFAGYGLIIFSPMAGLAATAL